MVLEGGSSGKVPCEGGEEVQGGEEGSYLDCCKLPRLGICVGLAAPARMCGTAGSAAASRAGRCPRASRAQVSAIADLRQLPPLATTTTTPSPFQHTRICRST